MRENENEISIVEFVEKICGIRLSLYQKEMLMRLAQTKDSAHIIMVKSNSRSVAKRLAGNIYEFLDGSESLKGENYGNCKR